MQDLFEHAETTGNAPEFTVSELSGAVKRVIEGEFGRVRVRGEIGRVSRPGSGHVYFNLKDQGASLDAVSWRGQVGRLAVQPEEGLEVIATGRMTTFPGQSKYQLIVEELAPAGMGALMAMLEKRKAALQAEGLFDPARKQDLPFLPEVIAVVTSPTGAVIRDILHRLRDRFPRRVMIWPVPVQGAACAPAVAAAIRGLNALPAGRIPRPDLIIVARGGGSVEDLWGFNEEIVVRAAAESAIPLISAVGHETDTTLIDFASDWRAPTPTAAAERAVPVRMDLIAWADGMGSRLSRALTQGVGQRGQRLRDLSRALPRPETLVERAAQRLDLWGDRLPAALRAHAAKQRQGFLPLAAHIRPRLLRDLIAQRRDRLDSRAARLGAAVAGLRRLRLQELSRQRQALDALAARLQAAPEARLARLSDRLAALDRTRQTLGYTQTLRRGYAVVRAGDQVVTTRAQGEAQAALEIEFQDGRLSVSRG